MLPNGHLTVVRMAARALGDPLVDRYRDALVLGALREDVWYLPGVNRVVEHLSLSHFYRTVPGGFVPWLSPGPCARADRSFSRARRDLVRGRPAAAFLELGHAVHLLVDMACPCHAHAVVHETDPYEWYVEAHAAELEALPVPEVRAPRRAGHLVARLARFTRRFEPDRTHSLHGRVMARLGRWRPATREEVEAQARVLVPAAAGHVAALLRLLLRYAPGALAAPGAVAPGAVAAQACPGART